MSSGEGDGGQALSLSLISLIMAATSTQTQPTPPDPKVPPPPPLCSRSSASHWALGIEGGNSTTTLYEAAVMLESNTWLAKCLSVASEACLQQCSSNRV